MRLRNVSLLILCLSILFSCQDRPAEESETQRDVSERINDLTKVRDTLGMDPEMIKSQTQYNQFKMDLFKDKLEVLRLDPLFNLPQDSNAIRLTVDFSWRNNWSGTPISLAVFSDGTKAWVEAVESDHDTTLTDGFNLLKKLYQIEASGYGKLRDELQRLGSWEDFSFHENDGWTILDGESYFLELKEGSDYKVLAREIMDYRRDTLAYQWLIGLLETTHYNEDVKQGYKEYLKEVRSKEIRRKRLR